MNPNETVPNVSNIFNQNAKADEGAYDVCREWLEMGLNMRLCVVFIFGNRLLLNQFRSLGNN